MANVYLGVGTNLGDRQKNITEALTRLEASGISILENSSIIESEPAGGPPQGKYLNCVIKVKTRLKPIDLLNTLKKIESEMGRVKTVINGPRIIDLDILLYNDIMVDTDELTIPHPRMFERSFVVGPLREIAPELFKKEEHAHH